MPELSPEDVFVPGSFPSHTYVSRADTGHEVKLLRFALADGIMPSVLGPSKSGKTVLAEKVLGDRLVRLSGTEISNPTQMWQRVLGLLGKAYELEASAGTSSGAGASVEIKGGAQVPLFAKGEAGVGGEISSTRSRETTERFAPAGMKEAAEALRSSGHILVIDDFHYVPEDVKPVVAQHLKEALKLGLNVVVMAVPHRRDDAIRSNRDLRGRVAQIDLGTWDEASLMRIGQIGFPLLEMDVPEGVIRALASEALGSPQLMQSLCLELVYHVGGDVQSTTRRASISDIPAVARGVAALTDASSAYAILKAGPKRHGKERAMHPLVGGGGEADNYGILLKAISIDPAQSSFAYEDVRERIAQVVEGDPPPMDRLTRSLGHWNEIIEEELSTDRVIQWDEEKRVLEVIDPHFLFFLRWADKAR